MYYNSNIKFTEVFLLAEYRINTDELKSYCDRLVAGDRVLLSGCVYTARDAAHKRIMQLIDEDQALPFEIGGSAVYYAGPTPTPPGLPIGSCGPPTPSRMDRFAPDLYDMGMTATIGKGERSDAVCDAICRNGAVYLCAVGGAGALAARCIAECEVIAFDDLGCESVKRLEFRDFPLVVAIDCKGGNLFKSR